jgi:hypothetical protein
MRFFQCVSQSIQGVLNRLELTIEEVLELAYRIAVASQAFDESKYLAAAPLAGNEQSQAAKPYYGGRCKPVLHDVTVGPLLRDPKPLMHLD